MSTNERSEHDYASAHCDTRCHMRFASGTGRSDLGLISPMSVEELTNPLLIDFWNETRLRSRSAESNRAVDAPDPEMSVQWVRIAEILGLGYGERSGAVITKGRTLMRARTTPSAGALYPFEVLVAFQGADDYALYHYDVAGCYLRRLATVSRQDIVEVLSSDPEEESLPAAVVAIVARPWKSMRKYGRRGYLYTHLDGAHAATNIALVSADEGFAPVVRLRFDRRRVSRAFGIEGICREPQALITLAVPPKDRGTDYRDLRDRALNPFAVPFWRHDSGLGLEEPDGREREAWSQVSPVTTYHQPRDLPLRFGTTMSVQADPFDGGADTVALPRGGSGLVDGVGAVALRRQSAKGFLASPLDLDTLGRALAGLNGRTAVDCADGPLVSLRLLVRNVEGIASGAYAYDPAGHLLRPLGGDGGSEESVVAACMNQGVAADSAVVMALHAPERQLLGERGQQGLAELHFHAASTAQRLCLGATAHGFGLTCLGGFDAGRIAELVRLGASEEEVIYVLAAGVPDERAMKWDRAPIAYSHGYDQQPS